MQSRVIIATELSLSARARWQFAEQHTARGQCSEARLHENMHQAQHMYQDTGSAHADFPAHNHLCNGTTAKLPTTNNVNLGVKVLT